MSVNRPVLFSRHAPTCATLTKPFIENHPCDCGAFRFVGWHAQFEWKLQDFWVGAFWKRTGNCVDLWLCGDLVRERYVPRGAGPGALR